MFTPKGGYDMMTAEQIIKQAKRESFYSYYTSLGYDHKTAAVLALFTYGRYRYKPFSITDCYDSICREEEYLPPEERERRRQNELFRAERSRMATGVPDAMPTGVPKGGSKGFGLRRKTSKSVSRPSMSERIESGVSEAMLDKLFDASESYADSALTASATSAVMAKRATGFLDIAGAMGYATDEYEPIEEKDARTAAAEPMSTFRMTTNTASAGIILNQLRSGRRIDKSMVRIEEMLNYFRYDSSLPKDEMFNIDYELMEVDDARKYLYINVQGRKEVKERQNIVILLDVSGSMDGNAEQTQAIIATIVSKLGNGDKLSLVTYSNNDSVELEAFTVNGPEDRIHVLEKLLALRISGFTGGSKGIERAYEIGKDNYIDGGNNQVILITDGDLNFGITDKGGLEELIELRKKDNLFLSVIGTGLWNYKDDKLEVLCKHGNGVYRVVNNLADVRKSIDDEYSSLVNVIAKDVKGQVEFNPEIVESYRLLGFENRTLAREDFTNDKVISEPFGSGGYGVALYDLKMKTGDDPVDGGLKYSKLVTTGSSEPGTIRVRYKEPLEDVSHELEKVMENADASYTDNLRLAFIVYVCAEKLRGSDKISAEEIDLAKRLYDELGDEARERNSADLYKLAGILGKSEKELGIGIPEEPFVW